MFLQCNNGIKMSLGFYEIYVENMMPENHFQKGEKK